MLDMKKMMVVQYDMVILYDERVISCYCEASQHGLVVLR
jgi:hypothetical protein